MKLIFSSLFILIFTLHGCDNSLSSGNVIGVAGSSAHQTPVLRDTQGNLYGYYEYLPAEFNPQLKNYYPVIFYWNGQNALTGNGREDIGKLLKQGLPQYISEGKHYPAIIISGMLPDWKESQIEPFVDYILTRYKSHIDPTRVYMSGFSAGGGVTIRYIAKHPEKIAAYIAIAPAAMPPQDGQPSEKMAQVPSWFIHNSGDMTVEIWRSNMWNSALKALGGDHNISRPDQETHYAWKQAYSSEETWQWLLSKRKSLNTLGKIK